jgi:hypothetical protein
MALPHHNRARFCNLFLKVDWIREIGELYPGRRLIRANGTASWVEIRETKSRGDDWKLIGGVPAFPTGLDCEVVV